MKDLTLSELSQPVRDFLMSVEPDRGLLIRDEEGGTVLHVVRRREPSKADRDRAWAGLNSISKRVGDRLEALGISAEEADAAIQRELAESRSRGKVAT